MKMEAILATVGLIALIVCMYFAFVFFIVGVIDEMNMEDRLYSLGRRFVKKLKGKVR